ncbi:hypothetical protein Q5444_05640 [Escherichia coli]|nr:hypothetical protein [Escherichia coli]MED8071527.1 hypothetical protein [Escherichia coli]MED8076454.1 hypothetical protein [Escherichia coli]MED8115231.1 hypothetical protein [Escherichia coli]MED8120288.1 hypothetical protein [Escherichia coli]
MADLSTLINMERVQMINPTPIYNKFKYVSAPCGSGKTTAICNIINNSTEKYILVQNTQELIKQTAKQINNCEYIITDTVPKDESVINSVINFLSSGSNKTLLITDKTFFKIPPELLSDCNIYIDDVTNFHSFQNINEGDTNIKNTILNSLIHNVLTLDDKNMYIAAERKPEIQGEVLKNILNQLPAINENDMFIMNNEYFTDAKKEQLNITAWKDLSKYKDVSITFLGANFENSLIYKGNKELFESTELGGLLTRKTALKDRLKVYYFSKNQKLSKTWKTNNPDKVQKIYSFIDKKLEGQDFYWTKNKSDSQSLKNGTEISPDVRGLTSTNTCSRASGSLVCVPLKQRLNSANCSLRLTARRYMLRGSTKVYTSSYYEEFQGILTVLKHRLFMFLMNGKPDLLQIILSI